MSLITYNDILEKHKGLAGERRRICKICGKEFTVLPGYIYKKRRKDNYMWYCSYTCYRKDGN